LKSTLNAVNYRTYQISQTLSKIMGSTSTSNTKKTKEIKDFITWFEIPAIDFQQAVNFYNHIFGIQMEQSVSENIAMAFFPSKNGIGGAVVAGSGSVPSTTGPLIYLNGGSDLNNILHKVEEAGGRIIMPKTLINEDSGFFAIFIDSQGNKLALHSNN
jgi:predicted enzyme related to lactoylglutathione lyase